MKQTELPSPDSKEETKSNLVTDKKEKKKHTLQPPVPPEHQIPNPKRREAVSDDVRD
jgi:hypothetical protein